MTLIESDSATIHASPSQVKAYIINANNLKNLLPEGKFTDWTSDDQSCSFRIQNAYTIGLELVSENDAGEVVYKSSKGSPFAFTLTAQLTPINGATEAKLICHAEMNSFLELLVKNPLRNLFNHMAKRISELPL